MSKKDDVSQLFDEFIKIVKPHEVEDAKALKAQVLKEFEERKS